MSIPAGEVLSEVALNADLVTRVVGEVTPSQQGPDRLALARIARDRDTDALEAAMARLDEEEREAWEEKVEDGVSAAEAVRYLKDLGGTWAAADGGQGRKMLAKALFERIEVRLPGGSAPPHRRGHRARLRGRPPREARNIRKWSGRQCLSSRHR